MTNLDELRRKALESDEPEDAFFGNVANNVQRVDDGKIFGLNAVERMFLSVGLFLVVSVLSVFLLLITSSIVLP